MIKVISIVVFIGGLGGGLVFPILPALGQKLGIAGVMTGLILSSNRIARLIFNLPAGRLFPRLGIRRTLGGAMLAETAGLVCFSVAVHSHIPALWLLGGRIVYGIGTSFLMVGSQAAVLALSDDSDRGRKTASVRLALNAAVPGGLILGGVIADLFSDNTAFLTGSAVTFAGTLTAFLLLPPTKTISSESGKTTERGLKLRFFPESPGLIGVFSLNFLIFLTVQGALLATLVLFLQEHRFTFLGMKAQGISGIMMAVMITCAALSSLAAGRILDRLPRRSQLIFPALFGLIAGFFILYEFSSLLTVALSMVFIGLSYNSLTLAAMTMIGDRVKVSDQSSAVGLFQFFGDMGGTLGPMLGIVTVSWVGSGNLYLICAFICLCFLPLLFRIRKMEA